MYLPIHMLGTTACMLRVNVTQYKNHIAVCFNFSPITFDLCDPESEVYVNCSLHFSVCCSSQYILKSPIALETLLPKEVIYSFDLEIRGNFSLPLPKAFFN